MADFYDLGDGLVVDSDGEIIECAHRDNALAFIARLRHEAKVQEKEWEKRIATLDAVLLRQQGEKRVAYGDTVIRVGGGSYPKTDAGTFAALCFDMPLEPVTLFEVIAAASGFKRDALPENVQEAYDKSTAHLNKRSWIESSVARRPAPVMKVVGGSDLVSDLEDGIALLEAQRGPK